MRNQPTPMKTSNRYALMRQLNRRVHLISSTLYHGLAVRIMSGYGTKHSVLSIKGKPLPKQKKGQALCHRK